MMKDYEDRGMQKWTGFYLAEHSKKLEELSKEEHQVYKEEQSLEEVSEILFELWKQNKPGVYQLNQVMDNQYLQLSGYVVGFSEDEIMIKTMSGDVITVPQTSIRNVEKKNQTKWYKEGVPFES